MYSSCFLDRSFRISTLVTSLTSSVSFPFVMVVWGGCVKKNFFNSTMMGSFCVNLVVVVLMDGDLLDWCSISSRSSLDSLTIFIHAFSLLSTETVCFFSLPLPFTAGVEATVFLLLLELRWCSTNAGRRSSSTETADTGTVAAGFGWSSFLLKAAGLDPLHLVVVACSGSLSTDISDIFWVALSTRGSAFLGVSLLLRYDQYLVPCLNLATLYLCLVLSFAFDLQLLRLSATDISS